MARVYATAEQVHALVGITPTAGTLRRASRDVDSILKSAVYDTDTVGMPTSQPVQDLFAEMVAEQVAWFSELGDETGIVAAGGGSIGQVTLPNVGGGRQTGRQAVLAPRALSLARDSELLHWRVDS